MIKNIFKKIIKFIARIVQIIVEVVTILVDLITGEVDEAWDYNLFTLVNYNFDAISGHAVKPIVMGDALSIVASEYVSEDISSAVSTSFEVTCSNCFVAATVDLIMTLRIKKYVFQVAQIYVQGFVGYSAIFAGNIGGITLDKEKTVSFVIYFIHFFLILCCCMCQCLDLHV